jgi:hypothetical protein
MTTDEARVVAELLRDEPELSVPLADIVRHEVRRRRRRNLWVSVTAGFATAALVVGIVVAAHPGPRGSATTVSAAGSATRSDGPTGSVPTTSAADPLAFTQWQLVTVQKDSTTLVTAADLARFGSGSVVFTFTATTLTVNWCSGSETRAWNLSGEFLVLSPPPVDTSRHTSVGCGLVDNPDQNVAERVIGVLHSLLDGSTPTGTAIATFTADQLVIQMSQPRLAFTLKPLVLR